MRFKKQFGQNFIKDKASVAKLVNSLKIAEKDIIIEIGPGDGRVTSEILKRKPLKLYSIEIDYDLLAGLVKRFSKFENFKLINKNILDLDLKNDINEDISEYSYKVIGSLPYNISKQIIKKFIEEDNKPEIMSFIIQKEVAEDYASEPPKAAFLANYANIFYEVKYMGTVKKQHFVPMPKVDGGIVQFNLLDEPLLSKKDFQDFSKFLFNCYRQPRKKLKNVLKSIYKDTDWDNVLEKAKAEKNLRAAEIEINSLIELFSIFRNMND